MFDEIHKCSRTKLHGTGAIYEVIVYRVKDNSSQKERSKDGSLPHVVNVNFFIDGPQADCSRNSVIVGACELQVWGSAPRWMSSAKPTTRTSVSACSGVSHSSTTC